MLRAEKLAELFCTKGKNLFYVPFHEKTIEDPTTKDRISHLIVAERTFTAFLKTMLVNPLLVRTLNLFVHKSKWRVPSRNPCFPAHGYPVQNNAVLNDCSYLHLNLARCDNLKMQPWRSDAPQISSVPSRKSLEFRCVQNGPPARREEGAYLNGYVTDEQRTAGPFSTQPSGPCPLGCFSACSLLAYRSRYARRSRLEKQPTGLRRNF